MAQIETTICAECKYARLDYLKTMGREDHHELIECGHPSTVREKVRRKLPTTGYFEDFFLDKDGKRYNSPYPKAYHINHGNCPMWEQKEPITWENLPKNKFLRFLKKLFTRPKDPLWY